MNKIFKYILMGGFCFGVTSCQKDFIDLNPPANFTDAVYFNKLKDFKEYTAGFYGQLQGWSFDNMDGGTDLAASTLGQGVALGSGTLSSAGSDWGYGGIRTCNILLEKATAYKGSDNIDQPVGEAYFFRAYNYFNLLKTYGGVPIVTKVIDDHSPELYNARNSRYEVVTLILADLDQAIAKLPVEQNIPAADKGRISKWAAMALKANIELYEATWEKYVGQGPDGDGVTTGAGTAGYDASNANKYLADAITMCEGVMKDGGYELWNKNSDAKMGNRSSWYLFNLEDPGSNPGGYDKSSNKEFILYSVYDYTVRPGHINITWTANQLAPSRKFVDLAVCTDGLPPEKSPKFQGYHTTTSEFQDRDLRLLSYLYGNGNPPTSVTLNYSTPASVSGYGNQKFAVYNVGNRRADLTESANWPIIRLAEVYLTYAEALYELNGSITDVQLNASINKLRVRAGVAALTNALVTTNGLDMKEEIRRERAVELYREGKRFDDLKRWGILESALNPSRTGRIVGDANYATPFKDATGAPTANYLQNSFVWGEEAVSTPKGVLTAVVVSSSLNNNVQQKHYLYPIGINQRNLNNKLLQNPGY